MLVQTELADGVPCLRISVLPVLVTPSRVGCVHLPSQQWPTTRTPSKPLTVSLNFVAFPLKQQLQPRRQHERWGPGQDADALLARVKRHVCSLHPPFPAAMHGVFTPHLVPLCFPSSLLLPCLALTAPESRVQRTPHRNYWS